MGVKITATIDPGGKFKNLSKEFMKVRAMAMDKNKGRIKTLIQEAIVEKEAVWSTELFSSLQQHYTVGRDVVRLTTVVDTDYAAAIDRGLQGGPRVGVWAPTGDHTRLGEWANAKGINPWALRKSIHRKGIQPRKFMKLAASMARVFVRKSVMREIVRLRVAFNR